MREERGKIHQDVVVYEPYTLWGTIVGNVNVIDGGKFYVRGTIQGNLDVERGGRVHVFGTVTGNVTLRKGSKLIHSGIIYGDAINLGGRLFIDEKGKMVGKLKRIAGETITPKDPRQPTEREKKRDLERDEFGRFKLEE